jgi:MATE family multidrug resistance protein
MMPADPVRDPAESTSVAGLLRLAGPLAASVGLGFFMHYANRTVLSWHSEADLAASLPAGMLAWTFQSFFIISCGYLGSFAAQHHAAGEDREAGAMAWPMFILAGFALVASTVLILVRHHLVAAFGVEPSVAAGFAELFAWYMAEAAPMAVAAGLSGFCGGLGRTRLVMGVSLMVCGLCIVLNYWLVLGGLGVPALGITGAGIATLATGLAAMLIWLGWFFAPAQRARFHGWEGRNCDGSRLRRFIVTAVPKGATEILEMLAFVAFTAAVAHLGTRALAASNLAFSTYLVLLVPVIGFNQGVGIACGQAVGAGRPDLARRAVRSGLIVLVPYLAAVSLACLLIPELLLEPGRPHSGDPADWSARMALAVPVMWCLAALAPADGLQFCWRFAVQGAGDTRWPLIVLVLLAIVFLVVPVFIGLHFLREPLHALVAAYGILAVYGWIIAGAMAWRFYRGPWPSMSLRAARTTD